jgi:hypothetical protein
MHHGGSPAFCAECRDLADFVVFDLEACHAALEAADRDHPTLFPTFDPQEPQP